MLIYGCTKTKENKIKKKSAPHHALKKQNFVNCPKCKELVLSHCLCQNCGTYAGREVIDVMAKLSKKERKKREKEMAQQEKEQTQDKKLSMEDLSKK